MFKLLNKVFTETTKWLHAGAIEPTINMQKKILTFLLILIFTSTLGVFVIDKSVQAGSNTNFVSACPEGCNIPGEDEDKRFIRMQIPIPEITNSCDYTITDVNGKKINKKCYYIEANLPLYIKKFYNFAVGVIAIVAVIMIMIGGLQWIFAAGNPTTITSAKSNISSAVSGLVLVLCSYVILYTINPNLVNLKLEPVAPIDTIEQSTNWCKDLVPESNPKIGYPNSAPLKEDQTVPMGFKSVFKEKADGTYELIFAGHCGTSYIIEDTKDKKTGKLKTCWGIDHCDDEEFCYFPAGVSGPFCADMKKMCNAQSDKEGETKKQKGNYLANRESGCDDFDKILKEQDPKYVCGKKMRVLNSDICDLGEELKCEKKLGINWERVDCSLSDECSFEDKKTKIRYPKECNYRHALDSLDDFINLMKDNSLEVCIDLPFRGANGVNSICCRNKVTKEYKCVSN